MFRSFFWNRDWAIWAWIGLVAIIGGMWWQVQIDVAVNEWFGQFYDMIQNALSGQTVSQRDFYLTILSFAKLAALYIVLAVILEFLTKHWTFRWRWAMNDFYMANWSKLRHIEGASQRVQEDTRKFALLMETIGSKFVKSILLLAAFLPILWGMSGLVTELPIIGPVDQALVFVAIISATFGTTLLALVGIKLPGLEFNNQKVEAAYRKELVYGEDDPDRAQPRSVRELFGDVRTNYFRLFWHYLYFDVAKWSYLQGSVMIPYVALGPTIVASAITLGVLQQIVRAFSKVEESFQFLILSWTHIVELMSVYKRLRAFEKEIYA